MSDPESVKDKDINNALWAVVTCEIIDFAEKLQKVILDSGGPAETVMKLNVFYEIQKSVLNRIKEVTVRKPALKKEKKSVLH